MTHQGTERRGAQPSVGSVPLYVNMLGSSNRYSLGRYVNGEPDPVGSIARSRCDLWGPSVTKARGHFWLYADESDCSQWRHIILFKSRDGVHFRRYGAVIRRSHGEGELRMPYVVFDQGVFRAWYTVDAGPKLGQSLVYAESQDGTHFRSFPGARARAAGIDRGAMTVEMVFRMRHRRGWRLLYTAFNAALTRARPALMSFGDPRQRHYRKRGSIGGLRDLRTTLTSDVSAGDRRLGVAASAFQPGDPVIVAAGSSLTPDASTIVDVQGNELLLSNPLRFDHGAGDQVAAAGSRKMSPSYVCRSGKRWSGLFTVFEPVPRAESEYVVAVSANRLSGPFALDRKSRFPLLSASNEEFKRSVENPTPVTTGPQAPHCPKLWPPSTATRR